MPFLALLFLCGFGLSVISAPYIISLLKKIQKEGQPIREDGPQSHLLTKKGTPTMGGIIIIFSIIISLLPAMSFISEAFNKNFLALLFVFLGYAALGAMDDYKKLLKKNSKGIRAKIKLLLQFVIASIVVYLLDVSSTVITFPLGYKLDLGLLYYPFAMIVIVSHSNAVNMTDGLDGLVTVPIILAAICLSVISFTTGHAEVLIFCIPLIGASLGFLFFNANPAKIFMGDVGSLSIGALLGTMSIITKSEIIFAIITGLFVIEALSVVMQVYYFKMTKGKRIFRMAPIHHHFEQLGWPENIIVVRFWIFAALCAVIGMSFI